MFERRLVVLFKVGRGLEAGIEIVLEVASEVDLVEGILLFALCLFLNSLDGALAVAFDTGSLIEGCGGLFELFEHGILNHLGVDHVLELKLIERENTDHLHQPGCQHLPLRDF